MKNEKNSKHAEIKRVKKSNSICSNVPLLSTNFVRPQRILSDDLKCKLPEITIPEGKFKYGNFKLLF